MGAERGIIVKNLEWIAVDWGTTNLRLWCMDANGGVLESAESNCGMASLSADKFETTLLQAIENWLPQGARQVPVVMCGMVGAKQGWQEVPYRSVPCTATPELNKVLTRDDRISVYICSGMSQLNPADVMRGEETQIAGLVFNKPNFSGIVCLPGTHSKWAKVKEGRVLGFHSFMTGELFALLANQSVLRFTVNTSQWREEEFITGVEMAIADPASIAANLFALRAQSLVGFTDNEGNAARLSGYLIGLELAATKSYWEGKSVWIIAASNLANHYKTALQLIGQHVEVLSTAQMTLAGLTDAYQHLRENCHV